MLSFMCPGCCGSLSATADKVGQKIICPDCGMSVKVPVTAAKVNETVLGEPSPQPPDKTRVGEPIAPNKTLLGEALSPSTPRSRRDRTTLGEILPGPAGGNRTVIGHPLPSVPLPCQPLPPAHAGPPEPTTFGAQDTGSDGKAARYLAIAALAAFLTIGVTIAGILVGVPAIRHLQEEMAAREREQAAENARQAAVEAVRIRQAAEKAERDRRAAAERAELERRAAAIEAERQRRLAAERRRQQEQREAAERAAARERERLRAVRELTRQTLVPSDKDVKAPATSPKWADAAQFAVSQGAALVRLSSLRRNGSTVEIHLIVENLSKSKSLAFRRWGAATGDDAPSLGAEVENSFAFRPNREAATEIPPGESARDILAFEGPFAVADLRLDLPASVVQGEGKFRFLIPQALVLAWTASGEAVVPALGKLLQDPRSRIRAAAGLALARIGPSARKALAELYAVDGDPNAEVQQAARAALKAIGPLTKEDVPAIAANLKAEKPALRAQACRLLGTLGEVAAPAAGALAVALSDEQAEVRAEAARTLGAIGPAARRAAVDKLLSAARDKNAAVRSAALEGFVRVAGDEEAVPLLVEALKDADDSVAAAAGSLLKRSEGLTSTHVPALAEVLRDGNPAARLGALALLTRMAPEHPSAAAAVSKAVADKDPTVRLAAVKAVARLGPKGWRATPELVKLLSGSDAIAEKAAIDSLGKIGRSAGSAVPALFKLLKKADRHDDAATAIVGIGKGAVSALLLELDEKDFKTRLEAVTLLGNIGPDAEEAVDPLERLRRAGQLPTMQNAIRRALAKIRRKN